MQTKLIIIGTDYLVITELRFSIYFLMIITMYSITFTSEVKLLDAPALIQLWPCRCTRPTQLPNEKKTNTLKDTKVIRYTHWV